MAGENFCLDSSYPISKDTFNPFLPKKHPRGWRSWVLHNRYNETNTSLKETTVEGQGGTETGTLKPQIYHCSCIGGCEIRKQPRQLGNQLGRGWRCCTSENVFRDQHRDHLKEVGLFSLASKILDVWLIMAKVQGLDTTKITLWASVLSQHLMEVLLLNLPCPWKLFRDLWRHFFLFYRLESCTWNRSRMLGIFHYVVNPWPSTPLRSTDAPCANQTTRFNHFLALDSLFDLQ